MTTLQLVNLIIQTKDTKKIIQLLNRYRIPANKSKYC